jgi:hypothetical protein
MSLILGTMVLLFSFASLANDRNLAARDILPLAVGFELQIIGIAIILLDKTKTGYASN